MIDYRLASGSHATREAGMCAMEWVAYLANEPHSDQPKCVSPVLKSFCIAFNDALPDDKRQQLRPYLARCIGTAGDGLDEQRAWMATDWLIRECAPAWLDLAGLHAHAQNLRSLGVVLSSERASEVQPVLAEARRDADAARVAARAAAGGAAWAAAGVAVRDAAGAAAGAAARAAARAAAGAVARAAARVAAWDAAGAAVWAAAGAVVRDALAPTVDALQNSAFDLLERMLPMENVEIAAEFRGEYERLCVA